MYGEECLVGKRLPGAGLRLQAPECTVGGLVGGVRLRNVEDSDPYAYVLEEGSAVGGSVGELEQWVAFLYADELSLEGVNGLYQWMTSQKHPSDTKHI